MIPLVGIGENAFEDFADIQHLASSYLARAVLAKNDPAIDRRQVAFVDERRMVAISANSQGVGRVGPRRRTVG
jgi:hypothetical protein